MNYGTKTSIYQLDGNESTFNLIEKYRAGNPDRVMKHYRIRIKVNNAQEEMTEYIRFTKELDNLRQKGTLTVDRDDNGSKPAFILDYPKDDKDGSYYIIKCYTIAGT